MSDLYQDIGNAFVGTATPYYVDKGHFYLESNNVKDGQINHNSEIFINDEFYEKQKDKWLRTGDMVMVQSGHVGHAAVIPEELDNSAAHALIMFRNPKTETDPYFLNYQYQTSKAKKKIDNITTGNTIKHILASDMQEFVVDITSCEEQEKIAGLFRCLDDTITLHQRKCDELKNYKKGLLQQMFPQPGESFPRVRFPGFTEPWEQRKFSDVFVGLQNNTLSRADLNYDQGNIKNVHYGDVLIKFGEYIDVASAELPYINDNSIESKFAKSLLEDGDIIIADTAEDETVGKCCEITNSEGMKLLSGLHTIAVRPQQKYASKFLGYYLNSNAYHSQLLPLMQGIKVTSISKGALQDTVLTVPTSIDEQRKIGECLSNIDDAITLHQRKCDELKSYKNGPLQKMFV